MRAVEFETLLKCDNSLEVPQEVAEQIPKDQRVQVIVLFPEPSDEDGADMAAGDAGSLPSGLRRGRQYL